MQLQTSALCVNSILDAEVESGEHLSFQRTQWLNLGSLPTPLYNRVNISSFKRAAIYSWWFKEDYCLFPEVGSRKLSDSFKWFLYLKAEFDVFKVDSLQDHE